MQISIAAEDLIIDEEVGSREIYTKRYTRPEWPGGMSGITVMIGFDVGYCTAAELHSALDGQIPKEMVDALSTCVGHTGEKAQADLSWVKPKVSIPLTVAMKVFEERDIPKWTSLVQRAMPNTDKLASDCLGALVSLAYNRGASFTTQGDRYREMRAIRQHMIDKEYSKIPTEFRSMKRLWSNGLVARREREAVLFERGLKVMSGQNPPPAETRGQITAKAVIKNATVTGAGGGAGSGGTAAVAAPHHAWWIVPVAILAGVVIAVIVTLYIRQHKLLPKADPVQPGGT